VYLLDKLYKLNSFNPNFYKKKLLLNKNKMSKESKTLDLIDELIKIIVTGKLTCDSDSDLKAIITFLDKVKTDFAKTSSVDNIDNLLKVIERFIESLKKEGNRSLICKQLEKYYTRFGRHVSDLISGNSHSEIPGLFINLKSGPIIQQTNFSEIGAEIFQSRRDGTKQVINFERHYGPGKPITIKQDPLIPRSLVNYLDGPITRELINAKLMISTYDLQWDKINDRITDISSLDKITVNNGLHAGFDKTEFGKIVILLTIGSGRLLRFVNNQTKKTVDVNTPNGSMCIISGDARTSWTYESIVSDKQALIYSIKFHSSKDYFPSPTQRHRVPKPLTRGTTAALASHALAKTIIETRR